MWTKKESHSLERLGGDEFTVLLTNLRDVQDAGTVARRIVEVLANPFLIEGREIFVTISMGIAVFRVDGESVDALLKNADSAMYQAKEKGRNNFQFYCNNLNAAVNERLNLEGEQRHAVGREDFKVFYQPQIDLRAGEIIGAEALVRWQLPQRRLLLPEEFLPAVMDTGLVRAIDEWVLPTACRHQSGMAAARQDAGAHFR